MVDYLTGQYYLCISREVPLPEYSTEENSDLICLVWISHIKGGGGGGGVKITSEIQQSKRPFQMHTHHQSKFISLVIYTYVHRVQMA